jgi:hypothetical protein
VKNSKKLKQLPALLEEARVAEMGSWGVGCGGGHNWWYWTECGWKQLINLVVE